MGESGSGDIVRFFCERVYKSVRGVRSQVCACVCVMQMAHLGQGRIGWQGERDTRGARSVRRRVEQHCLKQQA